MDEEDKKLADETLEHDVDPEWIKEHDYKGDYELEMYLSTDGKHTVHVTVHDPKSRREAVTKAMEMYDYIKARYGTKQAQSVKEYAKGANGIQKEEQEKCEHKNTKFVQSKTEKNPGRWFKSCADCGKFLGWQS